MLRFEPLGKHSRTQFRCGNERIDNYFQKHISQDTKRRYAACYVLLNDDNKIVGFYTLSSCHIPLSDIPDELKKRLPRYPTVPAVRIGWLACDENYQGSGIGKLLIVDAFNRIVSSGVGVYAILVDAIDENAVNFYLKFGFQSLTKQQDTLFIRIETAQQLFP